VRLLHERLAQAAGRQCIARRGSYHACSCPGPVPGRRLAVDEWRTRVRVTLCGDGTELCAKLTWLSEKIKTAENAKYLGDYVVKGAEKTKPNAWKGEVHFDGQTAMGTIKLVSGNRIELSGCLLGLCKSVAFTRI
jgi:uncharacterized protein (DUF2147 family)